MSVPVLAEVLQSPAGEPVRVPILQDVRTVLLTEPVVIRMARQMLLDLIPQHPMLPKVAGILPLHATVHMVIPAELPIQEL